MNVTLVALIFLYGAACAYVTLLLNAALAKRTRMERIALGFVVAVAFMLLAVGTAGGLTVR